MKITYLKYCLIFLILSSFGMLSGQYNFSKFSIQDGLPQSQVFAGFQDSNGYLWFGTQGGGLSRFNGVSFDNYTERDGLPSNYINDIKQDENGRLWVGTNEGLAVYNGKEFKTIKPINRAKIHVNTILIQEENNLWIGTSKGLYVYQDSILQSMNTSGILDNVGVNDFLVDDKLTWVATNNGLWSFDENKEHLVKAKGVNRTTVVTLLKTSFGQIWVGCYDGGLSVLNESMNRFEPFNEIQLLDKPLTLFENHNNHIWIGSREKGIFDFNPIDSTWNIINEEQGLPHNHIRTIFVDSWNNTWICTSGGGIAKYLGRFFAHYSISNGLSGKYIYAMDNDMDGNLIFSASNKGLMKYDGFDFSKIELDNQYLNVKSKSILVDRDQNIWIGTEGKGLVMIDSNQQQTIYTTEDGLPDNWIKNILEDDKGDLWFSTNNHGIVKISKSKIPKLPKGLALYDSLVGGFESNSKNLKIDPSFFKTFTREDGLPDLYISTLEKSNDNKIWFGTKLGNVGYIQDDYVAETYAVDHGLPKIGIRSISFNQEMIWIGTAGKGLFYADGRKDDLTFSPLGDLVNDGTPQSLYSNNIYSLLFDPAGNLWVGSEAGVDKINFKNKNTIQNIQHYGKNEGFHGIETCQNASIVGTNGVLWFGTMNGLMNHSPEQQFNSIDTPIIHFVDVSLFYKSIADSPYNSWLNSDNSLDPSIVFNYDENHISFEFKAINMNNPGGIKYQWRLKGNEKEWSPVSAKTSVDYSNLPHGKYCFEVRSISQKGVLSETKSSCFSIKKPFWLWSSFQLVALLLLAGIIGLFFRRWRNRMEAKEKEVRAKLEMKNNLLQLEQKALQLQMNPHFIFNTLNSIQSLVASQDYKEARLQIGNFAILMRGILSNSRETKISLKDEIHVLNKYLEMEHFCQNTPFEFDITVDEALDWEEVEIPPMILQPYVENAVIHGISHLSDKGQINISFKKQELRSGTQLLVCEIRDNGLGREKANELKQSNKPGHQSISMDVTKERLYALRGLETYEALIITDVLDQDKAVAGTSVIAKVPLDIAF